MMILGDNMAKQGKRKVVLEIQEPKYRRYRVIDKEKRILLIDFRCIRSVPYKSVDYGARRIILWKSPQQLQQLVDEYFQSCFGPVRNPKTGGFYENPDGSLVVSQIKPFTVSGLALYCHIESSLIKAYSREKIDSLGYPTDEDYVGPSYSDIMKEARRRIETYAAEQLYSRDGFGGGRFVLNAAFSWTEQKERAEIENMKAQVELKKKELKFRKKQAAVGDVAVDPVTITIRRAGSEE